MNLLNKSNGEGLLKHVNIENGIYINRKFDKKNIYNIFFE